MDQSLGYIGAAILGALATNAFQIYRDHEKNKRHNKDDKIRFTTELRGIKHTMLQSNASYYSAFFASEGLHSAAHILAIRTINYDDILKQRIKEGSSEMEDAQQYVNRTIDKYLDESPELKEYLRLKQRYEDLQLETAKNNERFWKTIGRIRILFPNDDTKKYIDYIKKAEQELSEFEKEVIASIAPIRTEIQTKPGIIRDNHMRNNWTHIIKNKLDEWNATKKEILEKRIDDFDSKIDDLLDYLEKGLDEPHFSDCILFCSNNICPLNPNYILRILMNNGRQMNRSKLQQHAGLSNNLMDRALRELDREGHIRISGDIVSITHPERTPEAIDHAP